MPPSPVVITLRGWNEKQAMIAVRPADPLPLAVRADLGADGAGGILDHGQAVGSRDRQDRARSHGMPIWCTHRIARVRGVTARPRAAGSMLKVAGIDVDEHRHGAAVADGVGGGDEGVADGDHLVAGPDADGQQRQMQRGGAVGHGAGVRRADRGGELRLEGRDLRALGDPAGQNGGCAASASASPSSGLAIGIMHASAAARRVRCRATRRPGRASPPRAESSLRSRAAPGARSYRPAAAAPG